MSFVDRFNNFIRSDYMLLVISFVLGTVLYFISDKQLTSDKLIENVPVTFQLPDNIVITQIDGKPVRLHGNATRSIRLDVKIKGTKKAIEELTADALKVNVAIKPNPNKDNSWVQSVVLSANDIQLPQSNMHVVHLMKNELNLTLEVTEEKMLDVELVLDWNGLESKYKGHAQIIYSPVRVSVRASKDQWKRRPSGIPLKTKRIHIKESDKDRQRNSLLFTTQVSLELDRQKFELSDKRDNEIKVRIEAAAWKEYSQLIPVILINKDPNIIYYVSNSIRLDVKMPQAMYDPSKNPLTAVINVEDKAESNTGGKYNDMESVGRFIPTIWISPEYQISSKGGVMLVDPASLKLPANHPQVFSKPRKTPLDSWVVPEDVPVEIWRKDSKDFNASVQPNKLHVKVVGSKESIESIKGNYQTGDIRLLAITDFTADRIQDSASLETIVHPTVLKYPGVTVTGMESEQLPPVQIIFTKKPIDEPAPLDFSSKVVKAKLHLIHADPAFTYSQSLNEVDIQVRWQQSDEEKLKGIPNDRLLVAFLDLDHAPVNRDGFPDTASVESGNFSYMVASNVSGLLFSLPDPGKTVKVTATPKGMEITKISKNVTGSIRVLGGFPGENYILKTKRIDVSLQWLSTDNDAFDKMQASQLVSLFVDLSAGPANRDGFPKEAHPRTGNYPVRIGRLHEGVSGTIPIKDSLVQVTASLAEAPVYEEQWKSKIPVTLLKDSDDAIVSIAPTELSVIISGTQEALRRARNSKEPPVRLFVPVRLSDFGDPTAKGIVRNIDVLVVPTIDGLSAKNEKKGILKVKVTVRAKPAPKQKIYSFEASIPVSPIMSLGNGSDILGGSLRYEPMNVPVQISGPEAVCKEYEKNLKDSTAVSPIATLFIDHKTVLEGEHSGTATSTILFFNPSLTAMIPEGKSAVQWTFTPTPPPPKPVESIKDDAPDAPDPEKPPLDTPKKPDANPDKEVAPRPLDSP